MAGFANDVVYANNGDFSIAGSAKGQLNNGLISNGQLWIGSNALNIGGTHINVGRLTSPLGTLTIGYSSPDITLDLASGSDLHVARFIVASSTANTGANYTTIASAITAAVATGINSTIFIQPGTYTENITLPANINLCAFVCDAFTPNVTIVGTITKTTAGSSTISGIRLQTNSAELLSVTGSSASIVILRDCYLNCTNATGIIFSSASTSARIFIDNCKGDLGTTGIGLFTHTSTGAIQIQNSNFTNTGGSSTASTISAGSFDSYYTRYQSPITSSSTSGTTWEHCLFSTLAQNATSVTLNGASNSCKFCRFDSGSASAISIGSSAGFLEFCTVSSSNTNAITGAGTLNYSFISFDSSSSGVNTSTLVALATLI